MYGIFLLVTNADEDLFLLLKGGIKKSRPEAACAALGRHLSHAPETLASILTKKTKQRGWEDSVSSAIHFVGGTEKGGIKYIIRTQMSHIKICMCRV